MRRTLPAILLCFALSGCGYFGADRSDVAPKGKPASSANAVNYASFNASQWVNLSRSLYQEGKYLESIGAAETALHLQPDFAEAYNNLGAAYGAMHMWDPAIQADTQAVRLAPSMQLARNNLLWAISQKATGKR